MRRTFVCLGDAVNLAARLMTAAPPGSIYVEQAVHDAAGDAFAWEPLPPFTVKGREEPVRAYDVIGAAGRVSRRGRHEGALVGRGEELAALEASVRDALEQGGRIVGVAAEAGMGKSRLLAELVRRADERGVRVLVGECVAFGVNTSYLAWRGVWRDLFGLDPDDVHAGDAARVHEALAAIDPSLVAARAAAGGAAGPGAAGHRADRELRRQAAQDVAGGPPGHLPARAGRRGAAPDRARGLPLARPAVARPAGGRGPPRSPRCRCSWCSRTGRRRARGRDSASPACPVPASCR